MRPAILDPNAALIVIDLQKGVANRNFIHLIGGVISRRRALGNVLRAKRSWVAFATGDLERQLDAQSVTQVVVTLVPASGGVETTGRLSMLERRSSAS